MRFPIGSIVRQRSFHQKKPYSYFLITEYNIKEDRYRLYYIDKGSEVGWFPLDDNPQFYIYERIERDIDVIDERNDE